jgi:NAD(P)-dependent dehydrogenase (short-subunit alcohol dehydrogenase family)
MSDEEHELELPPEAAGTAPGRGRLEGRRILIVGGGRMATDDPDPPPGNGQATSILAAREGAAVAVADRKAEAADETVALVEGEGGTAVKIVADVAETEDCERIVDEAIAGLGGLDGIMLNVGIAGGMWLEGTTPEVWDTVFKVNTRSHFLIARHALPRLPRGASLVFVSSMAGFRPGSRIPSYDASKAALTGLCKHVAFEGARAGVRANVLAPGLMDTPLGRLATRGRPGRARTPIPLGRQGTAWEVAYATVFLLSNEASYITGQAIVVDGGLAQL